MLAHGPSVRTYEAWSDGRPAARRPVPVRYLFFHTAGLKSAVLACVLRGATILPLAVFDAGTVMQRVADEHITVVPGRPPCSSRSSSIPSGRRYDLSSLRLSVTGAATVPVEVVRRMREDLHIATVVTGYGLTETTGTVSMCRHDDAPETVATTVGQPLEGISVKVVGESDVPVVAGEPGEILVKGFNIMEGYFDDPDATAGAFDDEGYLRTGDIGFVGRTATSASPTARRTCTSWAGQRIPRRDRGHHAHPPRRGPGGRGGHARRAPGRGGPGLRGAPGDGAGPPSTRRR